MKHLIFIISLVSCMPRSTFAQSEADLIKVKGEAIIYATPELMNVNIPIQARAETYETCNNMLLVRYNELSAALIKAGIEKNKIKSAGINVTEDYNYQDRERVLVGYVGNISAMIEVIYTVENLQKVTATLNDERFSFGYNLNFSLSKGQQEKLQEEAIKLAVEDAKSKALLLVKSLNRTLHSVHQINYEYLQPDYGPMTVRSEMKFESADAPADQLELNPNDIEIRKSIGVMWKIGE